MIDTIERLNDRDDVVKTEYTRQSEDETITVELWHDAEGLQKIFQKTLNTHISEKGIKEYAKKQAIAVRETRVDVYEDLASLYPETIARIESESE